MLLPSFLSGHIVFALPPLFVGRQTNLVKRSKAVAIVAFNLWKSEEKVLVFFIRQKKIENVGNSSYIVRRVLHAPVPVVDEVG